MNIQNDLQCLGINPSELKLKQSQLNNSSVRTFIQYENKDYVFTLSKTFKPNLKAFGITNRCQDNKFVLFLEFDNIYANIMQKNLENLLKQFPDKLDYFYIAATEPETKTQSGMKGSYHAICFAKQYKKDIQKMLDLCDVEDFFKDVPIKTSHKANVLRISEKRYLINNKIQKQKPEFLTIYPHFAKPPILEYSMAHYRLFKNIWKFRDPFKHKLDKSTKIELHSYKTRKKEMM